MRAWDRESRGRFRSTLVAAGFLIAVAVVLAIALWPRSNSTVTPTADPDPVADAQVALGRGEPVTLVAPGEPPKWVNVAIGPASAVQLDRSANRAPMRLDTHSAVLADLSPDPAIDVYRFEVELSNQGPAKTHVGLYVGRQHVVMPRGIFHVMAALTFTDELGHGPDGERVGTWELKFRDIHEDPNRNNIHRGQDVKSGTFPLPNLGPDSGSHVLAVDVSPDTLTWHFDGQQVASIPCVPKDLDQQLFRRRLQLTPDRLLEFSPRQAVGVCNFKGVAVCRRAKLIPTRN